MTDTPALRVTRAFGDYGPGDTLLGDEAAKAEAAGRLRDGTVVRVVMRPDDAHHPDAANNAPATAEETR